MNLKPNGMYAHWRILRDPETDQLLVGQVKSTLPPRYTAILLPSLPFSSEFGIQGRNLNSVYEDNIFQLEILKEMTNRVEITGEYVADSEFIQEFKDSYMEQYDNTKIGNTIKQLNADVRNQRKKSNQVTFLLILTLAITMTTIVYQKPLQKLGESYVHSSIRTN